MQRRYERFFIMFKPAQTSYSIENEEIKGYMKIEIRDGKGKIITYVQGLKPLKSNEMYRIYLISAQPGISTGIPIGWLEVDNRGRGEHKYEFNPDNIENSGLPIEKFNVAAVSVKGNNTKELVFPVVGYRDREILWKNNFKEFSSKEEISPKKSSENFENISKKPKVSNNIAAESENSKNTVTKPQISGNDVSTPENSDNAVTKSEISGNNISVSENSYDNVTKPENSNISISASENLNNTITESKNSENNSNIEENIKTENPHQIFNKMVHKFYAEMEELQKYKILTEEDKNLLSLDAKKPEITDNIKYMFEHNSKTNPFKNTYNDVTWIKIQPYELSALNICTEKYLRNQFIAYSWKKYKYLILGQYNNENSKYLLGVKDIYNPQNSDIASLLDFKTFIGCDEKELNEGDEGYWILEVH